MESTNMKGIKKVVPIFRMPGRKTIHVTPSFHL